MAPGYRLGVDVGGTFTDVCVITPDGEAIRAKVLTNTSDQSIGVQDGVEQVRRILEDKYNWREKFEYIHHGTTTGTNAVLEGKGAKAGLIVTKGHKDILTVRRTTCTLERTVEAKERIQINGEVFHELDEADFRESLQDLKLQEPQAIAVSLLNSFSNRAHEDKIRSILLEEFGPDVEIVTSTDVLPEIQEYERTVTTAANAIVKPVVKKYMKNLQKKLAKDTDTLRILKSDGDQTSVDLAGETPVHILMSGPAGGVKAVSHLIAKDTPYKNVITFDMGGTSTDCALLSGSEAIIRRETEVGPLTVRAPSVDVKTVGAGGGSIAIYNEFTKNFRVGPESSGATPGPAAYGKGGTRATVTDANLTLGYLPSKLLGGKFELDVAASAAAVESIAKQMGMDVTSAAEGIIDLVNESMHGALRLVSVEQGYDPRDFALVALGGAGPMHANSLGKLLGSWPVIVPPSPGVVCAQGDAITKMSHEQSCTYIKIFSDIQAEDLTKTLDDLRSSCVLTMKKSLADEQAALRVVYQSDMRYQGQAMTLTVDFSEDDARDPAHLLEHLRTKFNETHEKQFSFSHAHAELETMRLRVRVIDASEEVAIKRIEEASSSTPPEDAIVARQMITYEGKKVEATFWDRTKITKAGIKIAGPAVVTEMDSNTLILPGHSCEIDSMGNILIWPDTTSTPDRMTHTKETAEKLVKEQPLIPTLIGSALGSIRREMDTLMLRCAMSPAIREQQDEFNFGSFITQFLNGWSGTIEEDDIFVTNDVYQIDGAVSHLNDVIILLPIHYKHQLVGWAANFGHLTDVQGKVPGSMSINASSIFEDGLQIPIVKLYEKGVYNEAYSRKRTLRAVWCGGKPGTRSKKIIYRNNSYSTSTEKDHMELVQSKMDYLHVYPGDVLEWITWGGGGLGDPLTRPPSIVAQEVHRRLVSFAGAARNYGVVVNKNFSVNEGATTELRQRLRELRSIEDDALKQLSAAKQGADHVGYDRGGTMTELMESCKEETGLAPPRPQWERDPYGPHTGLPYVKDWYKKMREQGLSAWDRVSCI
ncbi:hypothetical protein EJ07DRAFT_172294 [Lizonia empirigonia]|nr:hypothetical protein EJ07DRAFT_172294 [Lizonia empirigonia]